MCVHPWSQETVAVLSVNHTLAGICDTDVHEAHQLQARSVASQATSCCSFSGTRFSVLMAIAPQVEVHWRVCSATNTQSRPVSKLGHGKGRHIHANEGFDHCGVDLVLVQTVPEGTDLDIVNAILSIHCEILPTATSSHVGDPSLGGEANCKPHRPSLSSRSCHSGMTQESSDREFRPR